MVRLVTSTLLVLLLCVGMYGQTFDSGSTGADGVFNPPGQVPSGTPPAAGDCTAAPGCTVTVPLREPPNHVYNFTTVTIGPFVTVRFRRNVANTPVVILAQGDVTINGAISVDGQNGTSSQLAALGGPGGFNSGLGALYLSPEDPGIGGAGGGPGGGGASGCGAGSSGGGGFGSGGGNCDGNGGVTYGIPELLPLIGGSGGAGGNLRGTVRGGNGGGGGGALLIASSMMIDLGLGSSNAITANGGNGEAGSPSSLGGGGGSGGSVRLVATNLRGTRGIRAAGGTGGRGGTSGWGGLDGGVGRIRLESARLREYTGTTEPQATFTKPGLTGPVSPPIAPAVRIVAIGGVPVPDQSTADVSTPDVTLPANFSNPVRIDLEANNVPNGARARVFATPQFGRAQRVITQPVQLVGAAGAPKRAAVEVTLPSRGVGAISAVIDSVIPEPPASGNEKQ